MKETLLKQIVDRLEGYGEEPVWEVIRSNKVADNSFNLIVRQIGKLTEKTELADLVRRISYDDKFALTSATIMSIGGEWDIHVILLDREEEVA